MLDLVIQTGVLTDEMLNWNIYTISLPENWFIIGKLNVLWKLDNTWRTYDIVEPEWNDEIIFFQKDLGAEIGCQYRLIVWISSNF